MTFPVTEHTVKTARHTTGYLACGANDAPLLVFVHGWPELSISWRHQLPAFAALGFRCVAPDMRGYGRSNTYTRHEDFAQEEIVQDMIELLASLGREKAVWIGHDWGSAVVWNMAALHPDKVPGVASLCVPYIKSFTLDERLSLIDRKLYPEAEYPVGQWDYQLFYAENFEKAHKAFEKDIRRVVKTLFRKGNPDSVGKPAFTASVRKNGGWFGGGQWPDLPRDGDVITEQDQETYIGGADEERLLRAGRLVHEQRAQWRLSRRSEERRQARDAGAVPARRLRHGLRDHDLAAGRADAPRLRGPHRGRGEVRPLDGAGETGRRECRARQMAGGEAAGVLALTGYRPFFFRHSAKTARFFSSVGG